MKTPWTGLTVMGVLLTSALISAGAVATGGAPLWQKIAYPLLAVASAIYASIQTLKMEIGRAEDGF